MFQHSKPAPCSLPLNPSPRQCWACCAASCHSGTRGEAGSDRVTCAGHRHHGRTPGQVVCEILFSGHGPQAFQLLGLFWFFGSVVFVCVCVCAYVLFLFSFWVNVHRCQFTHSVHTVFFLNFFGPLFCTQAANIAKITKKNF